MGFSIKKLEYLKTAKLSQFDVECEGEQLDFTKRSRVGFFAKKDGFSEKNLEFFKNRWC